MLLRGNVTREWIHRLPKAELHVHLDGSLRPSTMLELAKEEGVKLPASEPNALAQALKVSGSGDLNEYLERFSLSLPLMQTPESLSRVAYELAGDSAAENVRYLEVRFSPVLHTENGMSPETAVASALEGLARAESELGIRAGLIICGIRSLHPEVSLRLAELAVDFREEGVVAFDLAGAEAGNPAVDHQEAFQYAARNNLPATVHAGEAAGAESIAQAIHLCQARRIGHGTRLQEDPSLEAFVNDFRIPLEVCLTSNLQTRAVPSLGQHPLRRYFDAGLVVTLNTDNRLFSATTLSDEYWLAHEHLGFDAEELREVCLLGFRAAFLPFEAKVNLLEEVEETLARL